MRMCEWSAVVCSSGLIHTGRSLGLALGEDQRALVDHRIQRALYDLLGRHLMLLRAGFLAEILDDLGDTRAGGGVPLVVIIVKARLGFLAPALLGGERVADALDPHGVAVPADIDAGEIAHL